VLHYLRDYTSQLITTPMRKLSKTLTGLALVSLTGTAMAQDTSVADSIADTKFMIDNLWILISAALVFLMHLGFATLESGLCQKKNTVNILFKNVWIICVGLLTYFFWGFNWHYPGDNWIIDNILPKGGMASPGDVDQTRFYGSDTGEATYTYWTDFIFQGMFAATAATIVSGAVAERVKLTSFMIYSVLLVGLGYVIAGSWHWGGGLLAKLGEGEKAFYDFAGSTVVHAFGGFAALAAVIVLGPRKGKYTAEGVKPILGHSMPLAAIGVFLLFLGWFGFNGGSVLSADAAGVSYVFVTTALAAVAGGVASIATSWTVLKKPDLSMALNGLLAGLVAITAGADKLSPVEAIIAGLIGGVIVVFSILFFDKIKIDDPVGAISVHGICGIWGTLAAGIWGEGVFMSSQIIGIVVVCAFAFIFSLILSIIGKMIFGIRVSEEEEYEGLDVAEHGSPAYID